MHSIKQLLNSYKNDIKVLPKEFAEYQEFFDINPILAPALVLHEKSNKNAKGIKFILQKCVKPFDYSKVGSNYEIILNTIFKIQSVDIISSITVKDDKNNDISFNITVNNVSINNNIFIVTINPQNRNIRLYIPENCESINIRMEC